MLTASTDFNRIRKDKQWKLERMPEYDELLSLFDIMDQPIVEIDIVSILNKSESEYSRLLEFIGEEPLTNWGDLVDIFKENVGL
jgi:hypothetical protein